MRAASENLDVAPSTISRQIAQLEQGLGVALVERNRRRIKLTEAGVVALNYYREFTTNQEAFVSQMRDLRGLRGGTVSLAVGEALIGDFLLDTLKWFMAQYPEIRVLITTAGTAEVVRLVVEDEAHMGLVFHPEPEAKIRVRASSDQPLKVIVRPGHALADRKSLKIRDLVKERLGLPERSFRIRQTLRAVEVDEQVFLSPVLVSNSLLALKEFARSGLGITVLPGIAAYSEVNAGLLKSVPIDHPTLMHTNASVITRLGRQLPVGAVRLLQKIESTMPFLPAS